jgi:ATP-dependent exoDNAse (exonuclease V) beta subunit
MRNITYFNAGAGSGKTYKLTEELVKIFGSGDAAPENVILTTFTKAAAADFKRKTREKLLSKGMFDSAASLEDAQIGTVHSVGLHYIRKYWYILGRSATFNEMDDKAKEAYISRTLSNVAKDDDVALFSTYVRAREIKVMGKYNYDFWKKDLTEIIESCETFGITDLDSCLAKSLDHIDAMFPDGGDGVKDMKTVTSRLFDIAKRWRKEFHDFKAMNNILSFSDMETLFLKLLDHPIVQEDIRNSIKYVFVDEFQDSNQTQLKIFDKLSDLVQRSYWVGDPKQAIYRFRGCDTELVSAIMDHLRTSAADGNTYSRELDKSWRSVEPLVKLVNSAFVPMFSSLLDKEDVELKVVREAGIKETPAIYNWDLQARAGATSPKRMMLFDATAAKIKEILDGKHQIKFVVDKDTEELRKIRPSDIAILFYKNGMSRNMDEQVKALRKYGVPVDYPQNYSTDRAEVRLLLCLLNYMISPDSSLLKAEIAKLLYDKTLDELIAENFEYDIFAVLDDIRKESQHASVSNVVLRLVHGMNLNKCCGRWGDSEERMKVLEAIVSLAKAYDATPDATIEGFISSFPESIAVQDNPEGVKVLTYHRSKGLEWPVVIMDTSSRESERAALKRFCCGVTVKRNTKPTATCLYSDFSLRYCPTFLKSANSSVDDSIKAKIYGDFADYYEESVSDSRRLLYVGMTRARDYLVTLSTNHGKQDFFAECGCPLDLKKCVDKTFVDLWKKGAPLVFFEKIHDEQETPEFIEPETYSAIKEKGGKCEHTVKYLAPSSMDGDDCEVEHVAFISNRIKADSANAYSYAQLGTCIHNMFAVYDPDADEAKMLKTFRRIAESHDMVDALPDMASALSSIKSLFEYLEGKYGKGKAHKEYPFMYREDNGQVICGSMDLVWETENGNVVLDYKNYPGYDDVTSKESRFFAGHKYGPQLTAYKKAAAMMPGGKVLDTLIYYSVQGRLIRVL